MSLDEDVKETKAQKFKRIGQKRTQGVVDAYAQLQKLANEDAYQWTDEQVLIMEDACVKAMGRCFKAFRAEPNGDGDIIL